MALRIMPMTISGGAGLLHGFARKNDVDQGRANPDGSAVQGMFPFSLILEVALFGGGVVLDMMRFSPDMSEPMVYSGAYALGDRGGNALSGQILQPVAAHGYWGAAHPAAVEAALSTAVPAHAGRRSAASWMGA